MPKAFSNFVWILLFCAITLALGFEALTASQETPSEQQHYRADNAKGRSHASSIVLDETHPSEQAGKRKEKQAKAAEHIVEFLNIKLSDALIAIFTIVLAYKTSGLFKETAGLREATDKMYLAGEQQLAIALKAAHSAEKAADAAMLGAKAAIGLELPIISAHAFKLIVYEHGQLPELRDIVEGAPPNKSSLGRIEFRNTGRNRGFPFEIALGWTTGDLPEIPIYNATIALPPEQIVPESIVLEPGKPLALGLKDYHQIEMTASEVSAVAAGEKTLRFFCCLRYRDFIQFTHEACFVWRYEEWPRTTSFVGWRFTPERNAPEAYTRHT